MSSEKEILSLEDKRIAAMLAKDLKALEDMLHEQLLYTHSSGITDTKGSWLDSIKSGNVKYKSAPFSERKVLFLNAWTRTPQGWKFVAWQSCPQPT
jgi:hypothetical protein